MHLRLIFVAASGPNGIEDMKVHPFFGTIDWQKLYDKEIKPPFIPAVSRSDHTAYFDKEFTTRTPEGMIISV